MAFFSALSCRLNASATSSSNWRIGFNWPFGVVDRDAHRLEDRHGLARTVRRVTDGTREVQQRLVGLLGRHAADVERMSQSLQFFRADSHARRHLGDLVGRSRKPLAERERSGTGGSGSKAHPAETAADRSGRAARALADPLDRLLQTAQRLGCAVHRADD